MKKDVTDRIRKLRLDKGLSQENVAFELNMTSSAYSKIERGESDPNLTRLFQLAEILEVKVIDFFAEKKVATVKEPKDGYGNIDKVDFEKLDLSIQKLIVEINQLKTDKIKKRK